MCWVGWLALLGAALVLVWVGYSGLTASSDDPTDPTIAIYVLSVAQILAAILAVVLPQPPSRRVLLLATSFVTGCAWLALAVLSAG